MLPPLPIPVLLDNEEVDDVGDGVDEDGEDTRSDNEEEKRSRGEEDDDGGVEDDEEDGGETGGSDNSEGHTMRRLES